MKFGLFYEWPNPELREWRVLFEEGVEQIQYSETLGFDYCLIAEHHFTNYGNSPAPLLQALHIGQRTRRIGIGTASVILPMWQPLRLAEEVAAAGATHISNWMMFGGIEHEKLMRSIRLMGEEVIPALRDAGPSPLLAEELLAEPLITNEELQAARLARSPKDMAT